MSSGALTSAANSHTFSETPGSIAATWDLPHLSGLLPLGIPIEDLLWYVYTSAVWGTYYKFATGRRVLAAERVRLGAGLGRLSSPSA